MFASSCHVRGRATRWSTPPRNPYAETKLEGGALLREAREERDAHGTGLRMTTNYGDGPSVRFNLEVNHFVLRALTVYGDGSNRRPFIHVEDATRAYAAAVLEPQDWSEFVYYVGSDARNYRVGEIARVVREEVGPVDVTYLEDEHPGPSSHVDFARLGGMGYETEWTLREGIRDLAARFRGRQV